jgi:3'(2'), 5'-bisphosphate nucleotidase
MNEETERYIAELEEQHATVETLNAGSSLKLCRVAEGAADLYPRFAPTMEWDTAAGQAVVEAAGGEVVDATVGEPLRYNKEDLHNPWFVARGWREKVGVE